MFRNRTRKDVKMRILNSLGHPVTKVNISDAQMDGAIDGAIKKMWRWHPNFSFEAFYVAAITDQYFEDGYLVLPESIDAVTDIIPAGTSPSDPLYFATTEFTLTRNVFLNGVFMTPLSLVDYVAARARVDNYRIALGLDVFPFTYTKFDRHLYLKFPVKKGDMICVRCNEDFIPEATDASLIQGGIMFDNESLQDLALAMCRQIIGASFSKFEGMQLPGGQVVSGQMMLEQGRQDESDIMERLKGEAVDLFYLA